MRHQRRNPRDHRAVVDKLAVGLIRNDENTASEFPLLFRKHRLNAAEHFLRIDHAARIVRRIQNERARLFADCRAKRIEIRQKCLGIGRDKSEHTAVILHIVFVLRKVGRKGQNFISRIQHRLKENVERRRRAGRHDQLIGAIGEAKALLQGVRNRRTEIRKTRLVHVAVDRVARFLREHLANGLLHFRRCRHIRIAETEVIDLIAAVLSPEALPLLKHCTNHGILREQCLHRL